MRSIAAVDVLRNPTFRRLWFVTMSGGLSAGATLTTLGWVVVEESGSPFVVSLVLVLFMAPQVVAGPIGGVFADRYGRPLIIRLGIASRATLAVVMAILLFTMAYELLPLFVVYTLRSIAAGAAIPSKRAFMADVVPPQHLPSALALDELALTLMFIAGPVVAGLLLTVVDPGVILLGLACISAVALVMVPNAPATPVADEPDPDTVARGPFVQELFAGLGYIRRSRVLLAVTLVSLTAEMLAFNYMTLVPVFTKEVFGGGSRLLGMLNGTMPIGELIGAATMAALAAGVAKPGRLLALAIAATFAVGIPLGASTWLPGTMILLVLLGALGQVFFVMTSTILLRETPTRVRARVLGLQQVAWGAGALGGLMSGAIATATNPHLGIVIPSAAGLVIVILIASFFQELRTGGSVASSDQAGPESADRSLVGEQPDA